MALDNGLGNVEQLVFYHRLQSISQIETINGGLNMKLNIKAFAFSCGIFWGLGLFLLTWWCSGLRVDLSADWW